MRNYTFTVKARDGAGNISEASNEVTVVTSLATVTDLSVSTGYDFGTAQTVVVPSETIAEALTVSNTTGSGITVALSPALTGLTTSNFMIVDSSNNPVTITGAVTSDNGATYAISSSLNAGHTCTITTTKSGYDFGSPQNVVVPTEASS